MDVKIFTNETQEILTLPDSESAFYKALAEYMVKLPIPNKVEIECDKGFADYLLIKRSGAFFVKEEYNSIDFPPKTREYPSKYLTCINPEHNNYKFYKLEQQGDELVATYGRIGAEKGDLFGERTYSYPKRMFWMKYTEKIAKGYKDQTDVYLPSDKKVTVEAAKAETEKNLTISQKLYSLLKSFAKHHVEATCVTSNITGKMVEVSKKYLNILYGRKTVKGFNNTLLRLLTVCPRKVASVSDLLAKSDSDFAEIIAREENLLSAMEALVDDPAVVKAPIEDFNDCEVYIATEKQKSIVMDKLNPTLRSKVAEVYRIIPKKQQERFNKYLADNDIKVVKQFWHGSRNENWLSIIKNSLMLNPNAIITGKMFGNGIYFSPTSLKSWNYTSFRGTSWAHGNADTSFMALYATAYGKPLYPTAIRSYTQSILDSNNRNCVHAQAGSQTGLQNDEIIFYSEDAMVMNYLVEFKE